MTIVGSNLSQWGNAGQFETDPSTWGMFSINSHYLYTRSSTYHHQDSYSAQVSAFTLDPVFAAQGSVLALQWAKPLTIGNKYTVRAWVRVENAFASDASYLSFQGKSLSNPFTFLQNRTILEARGNWVQIEGRIVATVTNYTFSLYVNPATGADYLDPAGGQVYVDQFEVFEYIDDVVPTCTLAIDDPSIVVTDASGPSASDGSITMATTGGTAPLQYSKDGGATWQVSDYFAGLAHGIYSMKVMDADGCTASRSISVNDAAAAFDFTMVKTDETLAGFHNGTITITVTGTGGPFTFSKDGGTTYQAGNLFNALAPGDYTIAVKDASGNVIAHNITILAGSVIFDKIWFSRNPITYPAAAAPGWGLLTNVRIYNDVQVDENTDGTYVSKLKVDLPPDADGNVVFYNREAFTDSLKAIPPALNANTIVRLTDRIKLFKNNTAQLQDDQVDPPGATTASLPHLVVLGGISKFAWATIDYFGNYLPTHKKFMSWAPVTKPVDKSQEDYLNYFVFTLTTTTLKVQIKAYFDDGTNETAIVATLAGVVYGRIYQIPAGPANTGAALINPAKTLIRYELSLLDQANVICSEVRTYVLDTISHPRKRLFMFLNSLGGYEVLRFTGVATKSAVISKTEVAKFLAYNYNALDGEFEMNDVSLRESTNLSTGYIKQADALAWVEYMEDFLTSRRVFDVTDGQRRPIQIKPATFAIAQDQNYEYFVRFTADGAYEDENYTPKL